MKFRFFTVVLFLSLTLRGSAYQSQTPVDVVFTLDLSGSTNGLLDDLRDKIYDISNQCELLRPAPSLRIGVVGYGRPSFGKNDSYIKVICPLTSNIDLLASELYKLKPSIEKGDQFVGSAIRASIELINWSKDPNAIRLIYIVGNGMAYAANALGSFNTRESCEIAVKNGITVMPVYCLSSLRNKEIPGWHEIANITNGELFEIRVHKRMPETLTVKDGEKLKSLVRELTKTYTPYGKGGADRLLQMKTIDKGCFTSGQSSLEALMYYRISDRFQSQQADWDLIDFMKSRKGDLNLVDRQYLPDTLQNLSVADLNAKLQMTKFKRNSILNQLRDILPLGRQESIVKDIDHRGLNQENILDRIFINSFFKILASKGMKVPE